MPPKKQGAYKLLNNSSNKPIKKASSKQAPANESQRNALTNMFKKIEDKDSSLKECQFCHEKIKSCLLSDHVNTKCLKRIVVSPNSDDIVFLHSNRQASLNVIHKKISTPKSGNKKIVTNEVDEVVQIVKEESDLYEVDVNILNDESIKIEKNEEVTVKVEKKTRIEYNYKAEDEFKFVDKNEVFTQFNLGKSESEVVQETIEINASKEYLTLSQCLDILNESEERLQEKEVKQLEFLVEDSITTSQYSTAPTSQYNLEDDYYLTNFEDAIRAVYNQDSFSCLLNEFDSEVIKKFSKLSCK